MLGFRYHYGMGLSYERQGYIYFVCRAFCRLDRESQEKIRQAAEDRCGEYAEAVLALVTTGDSYQWVASRYYISVNTLYRMVTEFYQHFPL